MPTSQGETESLLQSPLETIELEENGVDDNEVDDDEEEGDSEDEHSGTEEIMNLIFGQ